MQLNGMINRYKTQSIAVNEEELAAFKQVADRLRMKPAALARGLFYRGLAAFLKDGLVHARETDDVIFGRLRDTLQSGNGWASAYAGNEGPAARGAIQSIISDVREAYEAIQDPKQRAEVVSELEQLRADLNSLTKKDAPRAQRRSR